jgi:type IV pilus assembly protein PilB
MRLGDILKAQGLVDDQQLQKALAVQQKTKQRIGDILIASGVTTEVQIINALHQQLGIDMIELRGIKIPPEVITLVSGSILRKHKVLPIGFDERDSSALILAMADPLDMVAMDDIAIITNRRIEPRVATAAAINSV